MRHLDYPSETPVEQIGLAALDDLLDRGDLESWRPLVRAIKRDPHGSLAESVLRLCDAHDMYGTSVLWRSWIQRLRGSGGSLADVRRARGLTQDEIAARMGISQSDVSKLERRGDVRLSTLRSYIEATGGHPRISAVYADGEIEVDLPL